jgi:hypothetical protein
MSPSPNGQTTKGFDGWKTGGEAYILHLSGICFRKTQVDDPEVVSNTAIVARGFEREVF